MFYPIKLDKMRNFRYGMRAISLIEKHFKKPIASVNLETLTMEEAATFIWAGLCHEDRELTPNKVIDLVDEHSNVTTVIQAMTEAMTQAFNGDKDINAENEKNVPRAESNLVYQTHSSLPPILEQMQ